MPLPDYQSLMLPLLRVLADGTEKPLSAVRNELAQELRLSDEQLREQFASGSNYVWLSRFHWAKTYLNKAEVVNTPRRGVVRITPRGTQLLAERLERVDNKTLSRFPEFVEWKQGVAVSTGDPTEPHEPVGLQESPAMSPEDSLERSYQELRQVVEDELLSHLKGSTWEFFEDLVPQLMTKLGYGGAEERPKRTGDDGIDGVIREDELGLERIYVQAKRWERSVGRPDVQAFVGSLMGLHANKGVFVTTSSFSKDATEYVARLQQRVILIDGRELVRLMYDTGLGVATEKTYLVKRLDSDYFLEI